MKPTILPLFLAALVAGSAFAQNIGPRGPGGGGGGPGGGGNGGGRAVRPSGPPTAPPDAPKLTEAQVANVLSQLAELEKQINATRGNTLSNAMAKLREGLGSDQAAVKLYLECDTIVNSERKEVDKAEARRREEQMQKGLERKGGGGGGGSDDEGSFGLGVRLGIQYIILTLEAHEAKEDEEFKKMVPKLQAYVQSVVEASPKLKGRASGHLATALTERNPIVSALQLERYLNRDNWSNRPLEFGTMYTQTILPLAAEENKESLPGLWDARINAEGAYRKGTMPEPEFVLWTQNELPTLRWEKARYLYENGPSTINAMAEMLKLIKDFPNHPDAATWVSELRMVVNQSSPTPVSLEAPGVPAPAVKPAGT